jgi:hypothetical protein
MWIDFRNKNMFRSCIMKLKWTNSNVATSPIFDGLFHVIKSLIILIASEINPHCILSQIYALFIEFYYALFFFFKDMHYNTMIRTFWILKKMTFGAFHYLTLSVRTSVNGHLKMRISAKDVLKYWTLHECLQQDLKKDNEQVG